MIDRQCMRCLNCYYLECGISRCTIKNASVNPFESHPCADFVSNEQDPMVEILWEGMQK